MLSTKMQFTVCATHILIKHLLKYSYNKYFQEFKLSDAGEYQETLRETQLEVNFKKYTYLIDSVTDLLKNVALQNTEAFTEYFESMLKIISDKGKESWRFLKEEAKVIAFKNPPPIYHPNNNHVLR